ncbi:MAG TPA: hypothetical protein VGP22_10575 [Albitalea sp.]|jgi:hypothetical protein|nr:hypothetical protein [Albitalea sp.]
MNAPLPAEVLQPLHSPHGALALASEGLLRYVWESRYGAMLIEVIDDAAFVNGERVEPAASPPDSHPTLQRPL